MIYVMSLLFYREYLNVVTCPEPSEGDDNTPVLLGSFYAATPSLRASVKK